MTVNFSDTIQTSQKTHSVDSYLSPLFYKGRTYTLFHTKEDGTQLLKEGKKGSSSWAMTALKVASYATIILPLIALAVKAYRHYQLGPVKIAPPIFVDLIRELESSTVDESSQLYQQNQFIKLKSWIDSSLFNRVKALAEKGNKNASFLMSEFYNFGVGVEKENEKHLFWLSKAANVGHLIALMNRAFSLVYINASEQELEQAKKDFKALSAVGNEDAKEILGVFFQGDDLPSIALQNIFCGLVGDNEYDHIEIAKEDISELQGTIDHGPLVAFVEKKVMKKGTPYALYLKGVMLEHGIGYEKNPSLAMVYYESAGNQGSPLGKFHFGRLLLEEGDADQYLIETGIELIEQAANKGYRRAKTLLGSYYLGGKFVKQSIEKGLQYIQDAHDSGYLPATYQLGLFKVESTSLEYRDIKTGLKLILLAAEESYVPALNALGKYHVKGIPGNLNANTVYAETYFKQTTIQGDAEGMIHLANLYIGKSITHGDKAYSLFKKAAKTGDPKGVFALAKYLHQYKAETPDGYLWESTLKKAISLGSTDALFYSAFLTYQSFNGEFSKAYKNFRKAAKKGHAPSQFYRGLMLMEGKGCVKNKIKGLNEIEKSADKGCFGAQYYLAEYYFKTGTCFEEDLDLAVKYVSLAADHADQKALDLALKVLMKKAQYTTSKDVALKLARETMVYFCHMLDLDPVKIVQGSPQISPIPEIVELGAKHGFSIEDVL